MDNWGVDASLNARHDFGKVRISARGTFTFARNKIVEYDELNQLAPIGCETPAPLLLCRGAALEDLQTAYPDGKYLAKNSSPEDGNQPSQNLFQTKGTTGGLTFVLSDDGVVKTINLITLDYFANDVGLQ